ncbi:hypothetical protein, partial [Methylobacterium sp.]|uniref:hypothetical protein n=1 Tax=Methylobacterium sp. TaxID=409 RepID=UPI003B009DA7
MAAEVDRDDPEIEARPVGAAGFPGTRRRRRGRAQDLPDEGIHAAAAALRQQDAVAGEQAGGGQARLVGTHRDGARLYGVGRIRGRGEHGRVGQGRRGGRARGHVDQRVGPGAGIARAAAGQAAQQAADRVAARAALRGAQDRGYGPEHAIERTRAALAAGGAGEGPGHRPQYAAGRTGDMPDIAGDLPDRGGRVAAQNRAGQVDHVGQEVA